MKFYYRKYMLKKNLDPDLLFDWEVMWGCGESDGDDEGGTVAGEETEEGEEIGAERQTMETMATCKQVDAEEVLEEKKFAEGNVLVWKVEEEEEEDGGKF